MRKKDYSLPYSTRVSLGFSPINSSSSIPKIRLSNVTWITVEIQMLSASRRPVLADSASLLCVNFTQFEFNPIDPGSRVLVSSPLDTRAHLPQAGGACMIYWINMRAREWPRRAVTQALFFSFTFQVFINITYCFDTADCRLKIDISYLHIIFRGFKLFF